MGEDVSPDDHEKKYFSYAAKLFVKCSQQSGGRFELALDAFRTYVCAGLYAEAVGLLESGILLVNDNDRFKQFYTLCSRGEPTDVLASFRELLRRRDESVMGIVGQIKYIANNVL